MIQLFLEFLYNLSTIATAKPEKAKITPCLCYGSCGLVMHFVFLNPDVWLIFNFKFLICSRFNVRLIFI